VSLQPPPLLNADCVRVELGPVKRRVAVVRGATLRIQPGQIVGLVGESGSGKTMVARAVMGLLPDGAAVTGAALRLDGRDLLDVSRRARRRGVASMVFQDPMSALNPYLRIGTQLREAFDERDNAVAAREMARALADVGIAEPQARLRSYPHELSGGMRQRVMIAMALLARPKLLVADEPTTALDVTIQAQVLQLLAAINRDHGMAILLISHDLGVVAEIASHVGVMYAGEVVEFGSVEDLFNTAAHPYTRALLASRPAAQRRGERLTTIAGTVPEPHELADGCAFAPRCHDALDSCRVGSLHLRAAKHGGTTRCALEAAPAAANPAQVRRP